MFFKITTEEKRSVEDLISTATNSPVLALPSATDQYTADTDTCITQVGCVLPRQEMDGPDKLICY